MKNRLTSQEIVKLYLESYKIIEEALPEGNYRLNNKEAKKIKNYF